MLNSMLEVLDAKNIESGIRRAKEIQQDVFLYGHASSYSNMEVIASEWMVDFELSQEEESIMENFNLYEYM